MSNCIFSEIRKSVPVATTAIPVPVPVIPVATILITPVVPAIIAIDLGAGGSACAKRRQQEGSRGEYSACFHDNPFHSVTGPDCIYAAGDCLLLNRIVSRGTVLRRATFAAMPPESATTAPCAHENGP